MIGITTGAIRHIHVVTRLIDQSVGRLGASLIEVWVLHDVRGDLPAGEPGYCARMVKMGRQHSSDVVERELLRIE
jgi:hypothetical protein